MIFDADDKSEIVSLYQFVKNCAVAVAGTSMFQNYQKEKINVFKIPPIVSKLLCEHIRNRESLKKSIFLLEFDLSVVDFSAVTKLVTTGQFNLLKSRTLDLKSVRKIAKVIKIPKSSKQSKVMLENIIIEVFDIIIGGNGNCHNYSHSLGETGGWTDNWCPHNIKYGSKKMILQESVVDPADLYLSLRFPPSLQVVDDPCTLVSHIICSETEEAIKLFGENRGCFEPPHPSNPPKSDHDCPELLPAAFNPRKVNFNAIDNPKLQVHPISGSIPRKVLGTKLSDSHKTQNECLFHDVNNCRQAAFIKGQSNF